MSSTQPGFTESSSIDALHPELIEQSSVSGSRFRRALATFLIASSHLLPAFFVPSPLRALRGVSRRSHRRDALTPAVKPSGAVFSFRRYCGRIFMALDFADNGLDWFYTPDENFERQKSYRRDRPDLYSFQASTAWLFDHIDKKPQDLIYWGNLNAAERYMRDQLEEEFRNYGKVHTRTALTMQVLAEILKLQGSLRSARELQNDALATNLVVFGANHPRTGWAKSYLADTLTAMGEHEQAEIMCLDVAKIFRYRFGPHDSVTLYGKVKLADAFRRTGKFHCAEKIMSEVVESKTLTLGSIDTEVIASKKKHAAALQRVGKLEQAENLQREIWESCSAKFGQFDSETISAQMHVAVLQAKRGFGVQEDSEAQLRKALEIRTANKGKDDADTLQVKSFLAFIMKSKRNFREAERLLREVLASQFRTRGPQNSDTLRTRCYYAALRRDLGDMDLADSMFRDVLESRIDTLGPLHVETLYTKAQLGVTLQLMGNVPAAEKVQQEVLDGRMRTLGALHPQTIWSKDRVDTLGSMLQDPDAVWPRRKLAPEVILNQSGFTNLTQAMSFHRRALANATRTLGPDDERTMRHKTNLVECLKATNDWEYAEKLQRELVESNNRTYGPDNVLTQKSRMSLATLLRARGDWDGTLRNQLAVLRSRNSTLGPRHESTLQTFSLVGDTFRNLGKLKEAMLFQTYAVKVINASLGSETEATARCKLLLSWTLAAKGDLARATNLARQAYEARRNIHGEQHTLTLVSKEKLNELLVSRGEGHVQEALENQQEVLEVKNRTLGPNHADTLYSKNLLRRIQGSSHVPDSTIWSPDANAWQNTSIYTGWGEQRPATKYTGRADVNRGVDHTGWADEESVVDKDTAWSKWLQSKGI